MEIMDRFTMATTGMVKMEIMDRETTEIMDRFTMTTTGTEKMEIMDREQTEITVAGTFQLIVNLFFASLILLSVAICQFHHLAITGKRATRLFP